MPDNKQLNTDNASLFQDILIYLFCVAGIFLSLNFFRLDLFKTLTRQTEQPVGTITFKYKAAQRRFVDRVLWDRLRRESPVYDGDLIRTADLSEATVTFVNGGASIDLAENSLVQIHQDRQGSRIDINEGGVSVSTVDSAMVLVSGGSQVLVEAGAVVNAGLDGGDFMLRVMEGAASFTGNGESVSAAAGETLALGSGGPRIIREASAIFPRPQARFLNPKPGSLRVLFNWNRINLGPEEIVRFEVAGDRAFTRIVFSEESPGDTTAAELEPGSYFWRVFLVEAGAGSAPVLPFRILSAPAPILISPVEGYRYQFRARRPSVRFQWTETGEAALYRLEAADNPEMTNPALSREVQGTSFYSSELGPGTWYWRVRPVFPDAYQGAAGETPPASFTIIQSGNLRTPEPQNPQDRGMVNIAANRSDVYFSWKAEAEARSYTIRISANRNPENPLIEETVRDNFYVYRTGQNILVPGQYFWAVFQTDVEGNNSALSPERSLVAVEGEMIHRLVFPPEGYTIGATMMPDIRFTWRTNLPFRTRFQISDSSDFASILIDEAVGGETFQGRILPEGTWYWRVQARDPDNTVFETPARSFIAAPPIPAPALLVPAAGELVVFQEGEQIHFSWGASPGAEYYQFKLYHAVDRNPIYENNLVEGTSQSLAMDSFPDGNYRWTVQGFASESSQSTRRTGLLSGGVFIARKLRPVTLDYPGDGAPVEGLLAYREPETARWSSVDPVAVSRFVLSRNRDLSGPPVAEIRNPGRAVTLPRLRSGSYYWTIRAETSDGFNISARTPHLLRVLPIPPLPEAANRLPPDGILITGEELRQNRSIAFSWDAVPGATDYFFTLENETTGAVVVRKGPMKDTSLVLDDLSVLHVGSFIWRLEAVLTEPVRERLEETNEIFQRGEISENKFRIEFGLPSVPEPGRPGLLYGRE